MINKWRIEFARETSKEDSFQNDGVLSPIVLGLDTGRYRVGLASGFDAVNRDSVNRSGASHRGDSCVSLTQPNPDNGNDTCQPVLLIEISVKDDSSPTYRTLG